MIKKEALLILSLCPLTIWKWLWKYIGMFQGLFAIHTESVISQKSVKAALKQSPEAWILNSAFSHILF